MPSEGSRRRGDIWDVPSQAFSDIGRAFQEAFGEQRGMPSRERGAQWGPAVDFLETPDSFIVRADLPGVPRGAIEVTTEDDTLVIRGEKPATAMPEADRTHRTERLYGGFRRAIILPAAADLAQVSARLEDGVLEVTIAKSTRAQPRRIEISG